MWIFKKVGSQMGGIQMNKEKHQESLDNLHDYVTEKLREDDLSVNHFVIEFNSLQQIIDERRKGMIEINKVIFSDPPMPTGDSKTVFSTGAVRDTIEGKPRMDLIPWDLMPRIAKRYSDGAVAYGNNNWRKGQLSSHVFASMMRHAVQWVIGDKSEDHLSAVVWNAFALMNNEEYFNCNEDIHDIGTWYKNGKPTGR